jgi:hypothetical protein
MTSTAEGTWKYTLNTEYGVMDGTMELEQTPSGLTGKFTNMGNKYPIYDVCVAEQYLSFNSTMKTRNAVMMLTVEATFDGDSMSGMIRTPLGDTPFSAERKNSRRRL